MNLVLVLVLIAEICLGACVWVTPQALRSLAALLLTRADVIEKAREEHSRRLRFWQSELGLDHTEPVQGFEPVRSIVRR